LFKKKEIERVLSVYIPNDGIKNLWLCNAYDHSSKKCKHCRRHKFLTEYSLMKILSPDNCRKTERLLERINATLKNLRQDIKLITK